MRYADPLAQAEIDRLQAELDDLKNERDWILDAVEWRARDDEKRTKELDRLRTQLRLAEHDEAEMARRLVSCRKAGDEMVGEIETLEGELDRLRRLLEESIGVMEDLAYEPLMTSWGHTVAPLIKRIEEAVK